MAIGINTHNREFVAVVTNADFLKLTNSESMSQFTSYRMWLSRAKAGHANPIFYSDDQYIYFPVPNGKASHDVRTTEYNEVTLHPRDCQGCWQCLP